MSAQWAPRPTRRWILLKADVSEGGGGWSDSQIIKALETSASMVSPRAQATVEEGFEAVLDRRQWAEPAVARIFDGEKEAKLIARACSCHRRGSRQFRRNAPGLDRRNGCCHQHGAPLWPLAARSTSPTRPSAPCASDGVSGWGASAKMHLQLIGAIAAMLLFSIGAI
jgi:hypothetical protein